MSMQDQDARSLPDLISAVASDIANLVRKESELVRTEISEKLSQTAAAGGTVAAGGVLLLAALLALLAGLILLLSKVMDPVLACVIVGVVVGLIGFVMVRGGMKRMKPANLAPDRSSRQLHKDAQLVKGQVQ